MNTNIHNFLLGISQALETLSMNNEAPHTVSPEPYAPQTRGMRPQQCLLPGETDRTRLGDVRNERRTETIQTLCPVEKTIIHQPQKTEVCCNLSPVNALPEKSYITVRETVRGKTHEVTKTVTDRISIRETKTKTPSPIKITKTKHEVETVSGKCSTKTRVNTHTETKHNVETVSLILKKTKTLFEVSVRNRTATVTDTRVRHETHTRTVFIKEDPRKTSPEYTTKPLCVTKQTMCTPVTVTESTGKTATQKESIETPTTVTKTVSQRTVFFSTVFLPAPTQTQTYSSTQNRETVFLPTPARPANCTQVQSFRSRLTVTSSTGASLKRCTPRATASPTQSRGYAQSEIQKAIFRSYCSLFPRLSAQIDRKLESQLKMLSLRHDALIRSEIEKTALALVTQHTTRIQKEIEKNVSAKKSVSVQNEVNVAKSLFQKTEKNVGVFLQQSQKQIHTTLAKELAKINIDAAEDIAKVKEKIENSVRESLRIFEKNTSLALKEQTEEVIAVAEKNIGVQLEKNRADCENTVRKSTQKIEKELYEKAKKHIDYNVKESLYARLRETVYGEIKDSLYKELRKEVERRIMESFYKTMRLSILKEARKNIVAQLRKEVYEDIKTAIYTQTKDAVLKDIEVHLFGKVKNALFRQLRETAYKELREAILFELKTSLAAEIKQELEKTITEKIERKMAVQIHKGVAREFVYIQEDIRRLEKKFAELRKNTERCAKKPSCKEEVVVCDIKKPQRPACDARQRGSAVVSLPSKNSVKENAPLRAPKHTGKKT
ncbi:MAG: uncharacterized protein A8A55_1351 [Amphiamblys sp. WSBS2006]|nr:MAG: uncharacterized protein A8A55_1351 [Amphiamblys sp. WSBS2006]